MSAAICRYALMILNKLVDKNDMLFGRALHGLLLFINDIHEGTGRKIRFLVNPNICPEVIDMLVKYTKVQYVDYDPHETIFEDQITNYLLIDREYPTVMLLNCVYGDSQIDTNALVAMKKKYPNLRIILDACLLSPRNYLKFKYNNAFDGIIYSFGYSKFLDLNYGGILSLRGRDKDIISRSEICAAKSNFLDNCIWENYSHQLKLSLDMSEIRYHSLSETELEILNQKLLDKMISVGKKRSFTRKRLRKLLDKYDEFLLDPDRFDWRLNYVIRDEKVRNEFTLFLKENRLLYSRHYQNESVVGLQRSEELISCVFNVLDDERQTRIQY